MAFYTFNTPSESKRMIYFFKKLTPNDIVIAAKVGMAHVT